MNKLLALLAAAALLAGRPAQAADVVRLGNLKFAHYGAVSYMKEIGRKYGLDIRERIFPKGVDIVPGILAGEVDLAASAADAAVTGRAAGAPVVAVAGFARGGARIVGRADMGLKRIEDLKGRKVGVPRGGAQELLLLAELAKHGLTWSDRPGKADVTILYLAYADLNQALLAKQIDAMSQSEPQSTQAISKGFGAEILKPYDTPLGEPVRVLVMTEKLYRNRDLAQRVLSCFVEATRTFLANPALAEKYVRENLFKGQLGPRDYEDAMQNASFTYDLTVDHIQRTTDLMKRYGVGRLQRPPAAAEWVKLDLLEQAKRQQGVR